VVVVVGLCAVRVRDSDGAVRGLEDLVRVVVGLVHNRLLEPRLVLVHPLLLGPGADLDAAVAGRLHGGHGPYADEKHGNTDGHERDLVRAQPPQLVVVYQTVCGQLCL
jgi:hypothetical protein